MSFRSCLHCSTRRGDGHFRWPTQFLEPVLQHFVGHSATWIAGPFSDCSLLPKSFHATVSASVVGLNVAIHPSTIRRFIVAIVVEPVNGQPFAVSASDCPRPEFRITMPFRTNPDTPPTIMTVVRGCRSLAPAQHVAPHLKQRLLRSFLSSSMCGALTCRHFSLQTSARARYACAQVATSNPSLSATFAATESPCTNHLQDGPPAISFDHTTIVPVVTDNPEVPARLVGKLQVT